MRSERKNVTDCLEHLVRRCASGQQIETSGKKVHGVLSLPLISKASICSPSEKAWLY